MRSNYETVRDEYTELMNLFWDCMSDINNNTQWANWHKKQARKDTYESFDALTAELMTSHGWTHAEWEAENIRRVDLLMYNEKAWGLESDA